MASKKYYYKGYECLAIYQPHKDVWFCKIENVTIPFSFEASRESTIQGNMELEVNDYIARCEAKGIIPRKSLTAITQKDRSSGFGEAVREQYRRQKQLERKQEREFEKSPWRYIAMATLLAVPALGYLIMALVGRHFPFTLFFPYRADIESKRLPVITAAVCIVCVVIYIAQLFSDARFEADCERVVISGENFKAVREIETALSGNVWNTCYSLSWLSSISEEHRLPVYFDMSRSIENHTPNNPWRDMEKISLTYDKAIRDFDASMDKSLNQLMRFFPSQNDFFGIYTSQFAHAGFAHLLFNLIFFFAFAITVELIAGSGFILVCFLFGPIFIAIFYTDHGFVNDVTANGVWIPVPVLGLSGMCSLFMGALLVLMPDIRIKTFFWLVFVVKRPSVPIWFLAAWFVGFDLVGLMDPQGSNTAFISHLTGAALGAIAAWTYKHLMQSRMALERLAKQ